MLAIIMTLTKQSRGWATLMLCLLCSGQLWAADYETGRSAYISGDYARALQILKPLAEEGDPEAQKIMGIMYDYGHGVPKDQAEALNWYLRAAEQGNPDVQYHVGAKYFHGEGAAQDYAAAAKWWELAANGGQVDAQFNLGLMYYRGMVMAKDDSRAAQLFQKAAARGHGDAQYVLGLLYSFGQGVEKNYTTALEWFQKSSDQGVARAQYNMGVFYESGYGVKPDLEQARKWYGRASAQGLEEATNKLAELSRAPKQAVTETPVTAARQETASAKTKTTNPRQKTMPAATTNGIKREAWVLSQPAKSYTLQVGSVTNERDIIKFIENNHIEADTAYIEVVVNGETRYNAMYGVYQDFQAANAAINTLPGGLRNIKPWVRNFGILQQMIK